MNSSLFQAGTTIRPMRLSRDWPGNAKDSASNSQVAPLACINAGPIENSSGRAGLYSTLRARPELMRQVILAADRNVASMILRIILSLLFEHGKNIIGPQFCWLPSSDGANASVPRRDMHHEKTEQNSR